MERGDDEGEQASMAGLAAQILRGLIRDLPEGYEAVVQDGSLVIRQATPAADETVPWQDRDEAMAHAIQLGAQFGRPIVTGIMVYLPDGEDKPWVIGVTTHSMEDGDGLVLVRCKADMPLVRQEVQRIQALNAEAMRRYDTTMHKETARMQLEATARSAFEANGRVHRNTLAGRKLRKAQQLHARRSAAAKRGWAHRRERGEREKQHAGS